jgi:hypothetical protein
MKNSQIKKVSLESSIQENKRYPLENPNKVLVGIQENRRSTIVVKDSGTETTGSFRSKGRFCVQGKVWVKW